MKTVMALRIPTFPATLTMMRSGCKPTLYRILQLFIRMFVWTLDSCQAIHSFMDLESRTQKKGACFHLLYIATSPKLASMPHLKQFSSMGFHTVGDVLSNHLILILGSTFLHPKGLRITDYWPYLLTIVKCTLVTSSAGGQQHRAAPAPTLLLCFGLQW